MNGNHTLVLNLDAQPLSLVPVSALRWEEAVKLLYLDRVDVLEYYDDWVIHSPSMEMNVPSVIMLREYVNLDKKVKFSRYNVLLRDLFTCQYCLKEFPPHLLTIDHVLPRYEGGKTLWDNVVAACEHCNLKKAHYTEMVPAKRPERPSYWSMVNKRKNFPIRVPHYSWVHFIDWPEDLIVVQ